jgi:hypothetical protein
MRLISKFGTVHALLPGIIIDVYRMFSSVFACQKHADIESTLNSCFIFHACFTYYLYLL